MAWARAVKHRQRRKLPVLWLFTDPQRMPDLLKVIAALPKNLCGVVFRHDDTPDRVALALEVARLCRTRRIPLVIAGDTALAIRCRAGVHLRAGRWPDRRRQKRLVTASAHNPVELRRAAKAGAALIFLSPVFATASHPAGRPLGAYQWARLARQVDCADVLALGGVSGGNVKRLGRPVSGAGAIGALTI